MSKLTWDKIGERQYQTGVEKTVLYPRDITTGLYPKGVAWNGVSSISQSPTGAETTPVYADNMKYLNLVSVEEFAGSIECFMTPPEFDACDGTLQVVSGFNVGQQTRQQFGYCYKTLLGNDTEGTDYGYMLHIVYNATASVSERAYATTNDSPEAMPLSYEVTTTPVEITAMVDGKKIKPTAYLEFNSKTADPAKLAALEEILYGKDAPEGGGEAVVARLPMPDEIITMMTTSG